jgi:hypothetical protein
MIRPWNVESIVPLAVHAVCLSSIPDVFDRQVVANVLRQQTVQVTFVERNHVVEQVSTAASHPSFGNSILPRASKGSPHRPESHCFHGLAHYFSKLGITVQDQVSMLRIIRKGIAQLLRDPETGRVPSHVALHASAVMGNHEEAVQDPEGEGRGP